jgi:hypothetical protein
MSACAAAAVRNACGSDGAGCDVTRPLVTRGGCCWAAAAPMAAVTRVEAMVRKALDMM